MKTTVTISKPNPYESKEINPVTGKKTPMVSYVVTGAGKDQYRKDDLAKGIDSTDESGNPLIHFTQKAAAKYGDTAVLERAVREDGSVIWFDPNQQEEKVLKNLIAGMDATTQAIFAQAELEKARAFAKTLVANRSANIARLKAQSEKIDNLGK